MTVSVSRRFPMNYFEMGVRVKCQLHRRIILKVLSTQFEWMRLVLRNLKRRDCDFHQRQAREQAQQRADRLEALLRSQGIDPDQ
jgi:hypothetical protein